MIDVNTIGIGVDTREVKSAVTDLDRLGKAADNASRKADGLDDSSKRLEKSTHALSGALGLATRAFGALGVGLLAKEFISASDAMTKMRGQLSNATKSQEEFNAAISSVRSIANQAQSDLGSISNVYARLSNALQDMGASQQQVTDVTKTMALALRVNGATAVETSSALLQLSQAFGAGKLSGDEFRSAMESAPNLMRELAKSIGVPVGQLKELAANGQITSDILLKAFSNPELLKSLEAQNEKMKTIGGAWQVVKNAISEAAGKLGEFLGLAEKLNKQANTFAEALSPGGLLGGKSEEQKKYNAQQKIYEYDSRIRELNALPDSKYRNDSLQYYTREKNKLTKQFFDASLGNKVGAGMSGDGKIAPNFGVTRSEESYTAEKRYMEKVQRDYQDAAKKQKDLRDKENEERKRKLEEAHKQEMALKKDIFEWELEKEARMLAEKIDKSSKAWKHEMKLKDELEAKEKKLIEKRMKAEQDAMDKLAREQEQMARELSQAFTNGLFNSFKKGESFGKSMIRNLAALAQTWLSRMIEGLFTGSGGIVSTLGGLLGGTVSTSAIASGNVLTGTGSNSIFGQLSSIKDLLGGGNNFITGSIEKLGAWIANGQGGIADAIGGALGQYSGAISNALGYAGAAFQLAKGNVAGAALTAVGTYFGGPIGGAIGGAIGGLFGGQKLPPRVFSGQNTSFNNGVFTNSAAAGAKSSWKSGGANSALQGLNEAVAKSLSSILDAYGVGGKLDIYSAVSKKKSADAGLTIDLNGERLTHAYTGKIKKGTIQQAFDALVEKALGANMAEAISKSKLPDGIKKFFDGLTKKEDVQDAISSIVGLKTSLKDLPVVFNQVRDALDTTAYKISVPDLKKLFSDTQTYTSLFYTQQENFDTFTKQLTSQFTELNATLPATRDGFRALVDGLMNDFSESGRKQFAGLVALSGAADQYYKNLEAQRNVLQEINAAYFSTSADYMSAAASAAGGVTYTGRIGELSVTRRAGDAELIAAIKDLLASNADTKAVLEAVAYATQQTARIQRTWNGDGLPETRVI